MRTPMNILTPSAEPERRVHKRRRRKRPKLEDEMELPAQDQMDGARRVPGGNQIQTSGRKRRPTCSASPMRRSTLRFAWFIMLTISQLLCDMAQDTGRQLIAVGGAQDASSDLDSAASSQLFRTSLAASGRTEGQNRQVFLEEPQDVFAVVGQPEVAFSCVILSRRGMVSWKRGKPHILSMNLRMIDEEMTQMWVTLEEKSSGHLQPRDTTGGREVHMTEADSIASNFTLHLRNVTLDNDDLYQCSVSRTDDSHQEIKSRRARLSVLKAPDWLRLSPSRTFSLEDDSDAGSENPQDTPSSANPENSISAPVSVQVVQLQENERLRLECSTGPARPRAEIVWLDGNTNQPINQSNPDDPHIETSYERATGGSSSAQLESTTSVLSVRADRQKHHDKVYTCQTRHLAYELAANGSLTWAPNPGEPLKPLRQSARLSVNFRPRVELTNLESATPSEGSEVRFSCRAEARPAHHLVFNWFIDEQQIEGAHEAELVIGRVTRQMHMRELKCVVRNELGAGQATFKLAVNYAPAYVTHLLPASLQPDFMAAAQDEFVLEHKQHLRSRHQNQTKMETNDFKRLRPAWSGELAAVVEEGGNITLHCDFDSNPKLSSIAWYRISTDYLTLQAVTPDYANDLIEHGAIHAILRADPDEAQPDQVVGEHHEKRHITSESATLEAGGGGLQRDRKLGGVRNHSIERQLDYERMSNELEAFLRAAEARKAKLNESRSNDQLVDLTHGLLTQLAPDYPMLSAATHRIREPLSFVMRPTSQRQEWSSDHHRPSKQLVLLEGSIDTPANDTPNPGGPPAKVLNERMASLSSSSLVLKRVDHQQVGKYVCVAKSDGKSSVRRAKATVLVLKKEPRIISVSRQKAHMSQLRVECLVQVNTLLNDPKLDVYWLRGGKPIKERHDYSFGAIKNITIKREVSPDALFVRSTLMIEGSQNSDFGQFECRAINTLGADSMQIKVEPLAPLGLASRILILVILVSVFAFVLLLTLALALCTRARPKSAIRNGKSAPSWAILSKAGKKVDVVLANDSKAQPQRPPVPPPQPNSGRGSSSPSSQSSHSATKRSINSSEASTAITRQLLDADHHHHHSNQQRRLNQMQPSRPESALSPSSLNYCQPDGSSHSMRAGFARASLRSDYQTPALRSPQQSNKFAAIHETLENKLNFAGLYPNIAQLAESQAAPSAQAAKPNGAAQINGDSDQERPAGKAPAGFIARSWNKFLRNGQDDPLKSLDSNRLRGQRGSLGRGTNGKSRPTISMPINGLESQTERRSSLSGSLTHIGGNSRGPTKSPGLGAGAKPATMLRLNHMSVEPSLVSSKANLIQDSGTASDGTTSSGRSSSTSQNLHQRQQVAPPPHLAGGPSQLQQQLAWTNQLAASCNHENILYANSANLYDLASDQANNYQQAMINPYGQYQSPSQHQQQRALYLPNQMEDLYQQQQQQIMMQTPGEQYQLPTLMSEPYLEAAAAVQQYDGRSFYATLCNGGINKFGQHQQQQQLLSQHQMNHNGHHSLDDLGGYGSLQPARVHFGPMLAAGSPTGLAFPSVMPQPKQMVKIVDEANAEAHFESNYGTLLSRSFKTLGYNQQRQQANSNGNNISNLYRDSSASSSPNSLTTHANMSNTISSAAAAAAATTATTTSISQRTQLPSHQLLNNSNLSTSHHQDHNLNHQDNCQQQQQAAFSLTHDKFTGYSGGGQHSDADQVICDEMTMQRKDGPREKSEDEPEMTSMNNDHGPRTSHPSSATISLEPSPACEPQRLTAVIQSDGLTTTTSLGGGDDGNGENLSRDHPATHV